MTAVTRRGVLASSVALAACGQSAAPPPDQSGFGAGIAGIGEVRQIRGRGLYVETAGQRSAPPVLYLHGGPGAGCSAKMRRFHDPAKYRMVLFDQRGSGRSRPHADLVGNTTWDLVADIEKLRTKLGIERWYEHYELRVAKVERAYSGPEGR